MQSLSGVFKVNSKTFFAPPNLHLHFLVLKIKEKCIFLLKGEEAGFY